MKFYICKTRLLTKLLCSKKYSNSNINNKNIINIRNIIGNTLYTISTLYTS